MKKFIIFTLFSAFLFGQSLRIYTEENPPWNYMENTKIKGISTQIVKAIQKEVGNSDKIHLIPWTRAYNETLKMPNRILYSTARIPQRENLFYWIGPITSNKVYFYKNRDNPKVFKTLEDAKKASTIDAGPSTNAAHMMLKEKGFTNLSNLSREIASLRGLANKRVELLALGEHNFHLKSILEGVDASQIQNTGVAIYDNELHIAISKSTNEEVVKKWKNAFEKLQKNGTIQKIVQKESMRIKNATKN